MRTPSLTRRCSRPWEERGIGCGIRYALKAVRGEAWGICPFARDSKVLIQDPTLDL